MPTTSKALPRSLLLPGLSLLLLSAASPGWALQTNAPVLDPLAVPKYVMPLVVPPQMPPTSANGQPCSGAACPAAQYNLSMRQFMQQMLPGGPFNALTGRSDAFPATPVWSYGRQEDPVPALAPAPLTASSFNSPALTVENVAGNATSVRWINELVSINPATGKPYPAGSGKRTFLTHLLPIDPTLAWANPGKALCLPATPGGVAASTAEVAATDCTPDPALLPVDAQGVVAPYAGPVPIITHVHGADVTPDSDGFASGWWLPQADNIPAGYAMTGRAYDQNQRANAMPGSAWFNYPNTQPQTTLWYHDHTLGITHTNVYAGAAGFWLIRPNSASPTALFKTDLPGCSLPGSASPFGRGTNPALSYSTLLNCSNNLASAAAATVLNTLSVLSGKTSAPGCDPNYSLSCRAAIREIPLVLADRSFRTDGTLFYAGSRNDATPVNPGVTVPFAPATDIAPIIDPEFFATLLTVNGQTWPNLQVAAQRYRLRILNGADARSFNLALFSLSNAQQTVAHALLRKADGVDGTLPNLAYQGGVYHGRYASVTFPAGTELPFYQIGAEQGFLPKVVKIMTGRMAALPGGAGAKDPVLAACAPKSNPQDPNCERGLLVTPAERADVIVDFSGISAGSVVRMINTAQDSPFQGFPIMDPPPTVGATDQLLEFNVVSRFTNALTPGGVVPPLDLSTPPAQLSLSTVAEAPLVAPAAPVVRTVTLKEYESQRMCADTDPVTGNITAVSTFATAQLNGFDVTCLHAFPDGGGAPYGPRIDMLGQLAGGAPSTNHWADPITQIPTVNSVQEWDVYNFTPDSHPIHVHGVRFQIIGRDNLSTDLASNTAAVPVSLASGPDAGSFGALPTEAGYKDTLDALPRSRVRMLANFTRPGLYQWHCHITEHEDNEMMLPMCVVPAGASPSACAAPQTSSSTLGNVAPPAWPVSPAAQ